MLSNDPRDVIRKKLLESQKQGQPLKMPDGIQGNVEVKDVTVDKATGVQVKNPMAQANFNLTAFLIGTIFAFWYYGIKSFWYWLPIMVGLLFFFVDSSVTAEAIEKGLSMGAIFKDAIFWIVIASCWAVVPPWIIGTKMKRGIPVSKGQLLMLNLPGTFMLFMIIYDIAFIIYMMVIGA